MGPRICKHCGADVPPKSLACPECGSDEETGWADEGKIHDALWAPPDEEEISADYERVVRSLGGRTADRGSRPNVIILVIALISSIAFILAFVV